VVVLGVVIRGAAVANHRVVNPSGGSLGETAPVGRRILRERFIESRRLVVCEPHSGFYRVAGSKSMLQAAVIAVRSLYSIILNAVRQVRRLQIGPDGLLRADRLVVLSAVRVTAHGFIRPGPVRAAHAEHGREGLKQFRLVSSHTDAGIGVFVTAAVAGLVQLVALAVVQLLLWLHEVGLPLGSHRVCVFFRGLRDRVGVGPRKRHGCHGAAVAAEEQKGQVLRERRRWKQGQLTSRTAKMFGIKSM
jgi:hypothetical protein